MEAPIKKSDFMSFSPEAILRDRMGPGATKVSFPLYQEKEDGELELVSLSTPGEILHWRKEHPGIPLFVHRNETDSAWGEGEERFVETVESYENLAPADRQQRFEDVREDLAEALGDRDVQKRNEKVWSASEETFLLVKGALGQAGALSQGEYLEENKRVVDDILARLVGHISDKMETRRLFAQLGDFGDSCTLSHINRVFLQTMKFLHYFDYNLDRGLETAVEKLFHPGQRYFLHFERPFRSVFREGLKSWDKDRLSRAGLAGLFHDVGKIPNLSYFESEESYDRAAIEAHALKGYELMSGMGAWAAEAAFVAGSHHEYGGHPSGYGIRRTRPEMAPSPGAPNLVSADLGVVLRGGARDHLLTEVVQIVDVYDALRCNNRRYRKRAFTEAETLTIMREMTRADRKLNLVLFDLFIGFTAADLTGDDLKSTFDASKLLR